MIDLALASRIPPQAWLDAGPRAIVTAEALLDEALSETEQAASRQAGRGPQMSG